MTDCLLSHRLQHEERLAQEAEESRRREEEARLMAEQERLREEVQRLQDEKEAQERAKIEQEENERLQKQVRNAASFLRILSDTLHCINTCTDCTFIDFPALNFQELLSCVRAVAWK